MSKMSEHIKRVLSFTERPPFTILQTQAMCEICHTISDGGRQDRLDCPRCMAVEERGVGSMIQNYLARNSYEKER